MNAFVAIVLITVSGLRAAQALTGDWGGAHVRLELGAKGGVIEFDCAHGELSRALVPDKNGRFDVPGTFRQEHGGPAQIDQPPRPAWVRYTGRVMGDRLTLTVTRRGTFALERGKEPELVKCR